ncbi:hypothetical protein ACQCWA_00195 [Rossellomorea aquimaris]|uniref:hypothetical protein n=1 Tax=Rossellomorea aquimaris TaxID=189382 RepID=UPI003CF95314
MKLHFRYITFILGLIILLLISLLLVNDDMAVNYLGVSSTAISIVLALIAIGFSFYDVAGQSRIQSNMEKQINKLTIEIDTLKDSNERAENYLKSVEGLFVKLENNLHKFEPNDELKISSINPIESQFRELYLNEIYEKMIPVFDGCFVVGQKLNYNEIKNFLQALEKSLFTKDQVEIYVEALLKKGIIEPTTGFKESDVELEIYKVIHLPEGR